MIGNTLISIMRKSKSFTNNFPSSNVKTFCAVNGFSSESALLIQSRFHSSLPNCIPANRSAIVRNFVISGFRTFQHYSTEVTLGISTLLSYVPVSLGTTYQAGALTLFTPMILLNHKVRRPSLSLLKTLPSVAKTAL